MLPPWLRPTLLVALVLSAVSVITDGTWGTGDSITHYLFARHAWDHPILLLDHWAKPVFTVLASPFAQYGFLGIKVYQALVIAITAGLLWFIQAGRQRPMPWLPLVLFSLCPDVIMASQSGLTEPTFGLVLAGGVLLLLGGNNVAGALLLSALPFCRTEGFLLLPVFGLYMISGNAPKWQVLLLASGTLIMSGLYTATGHDVSHVFTGNPYAVGALKYGSGPLWHFAEHLIYVLGLPVYVLFWFGLMVMTFKVRNDWRGTLLLVGPVVVYLLSHSLFWWKGLFGSAGLSRVLIAIAPLCAIIASEAIIAIREAIDARLSGKGRWAVVALVGYVLIFPFTSNHAALQLSEFTLTPLQERIVQANTALAREGLGNRDVIGSEPYWWVITATDPFAKYGNRMRPFAKEEFGPGIVVAWDSWLGPINAGITYQSMIDDPDLRAVAIYGDGSGQPMLAVFEAIGPQ
jgi:hypothetical protein